MEHDSGIQPWSPDLQNDLNSSSAASPASGKPDAVDPIQFIQNHPILFWGGTWSALLVVAAIAITGLTSPTFVEQEANSSRQPDSVSIESSPASSPDESNIPFWSWVALLSSCAAGSWILSNKLKQAQQFRSFPKSLRASASKRQIQKLPTQIRSNSKVKTPLTSSATVATSEAFPNMPLSPQPASPDFAVFSMQPEDSPSEKSHPTTVTVVPTEESHPLDWREESLADLMDIRRRRSFSSRF